MKRSTKVKLIDRRTKRLRPAQLLLGHSELESRHWCLGIEVDGGALLDGRVAAFEWRRLPQAPGHKPPAKL